MRAVIRRVSRAEVAISVAVKGTIQNGLPVFLAIEESVTMQAEQDCLRQIPNEGNKGSCEQE